MVEGDKQKPKANPWEYSAWFGIIYGVLALAIYASAMHLPMSAQVNQGLLITGLAGIVLGVVALLALKI